jgi:hypothetical protein
MYDAFREGDRWAVYKLDESNHPTGNAVKLVEFESDAVSVISSLTADDTDARKGYISPRPAGLLSRHKTGVTIFKGQDGYRYMFIVTSNSYKDREDETITTKSLTRYVEKAWAVEGKCLPNNTLELWHTGKPIGDVIWADMEGPFLIEVAKERPNKQLTLNLHGRSIKTTVKAIWDAIEALDIRWGASHGFKYPENAKTKDGTYHYIAKFETSILPLDAAANPYTFAGVINDMDRNEFLEDLLQDVNKPGISKALRKGVGQLNNILKRQGLQHKANKPASKGLLEDLTTGIDGVLAQITDSGDTTLRDRIIQVIAETLTAAPAADAPVSDEAVVTEYMEDEPTEEAAVVDPEMVAKQLKLMTRLIASQEQIAEDNRKTREDNERTRDAVIEIASVVKGLKDVTKLPDANEKLSDRMTELEKRLKSVGNGPRRATESTDKKSIVEDTALVEQIKKQSERFEELIPGSGIRVKVEGK